MDNRTIANRLIDYAHHLEAHEASLYRIKAYRRAAETILRLEHPAADIVAERGPKGLKELPGIGAHLSYTIDSLAHGAVSYAGRRGRSCRFAEFVVSWVMHIDTALEAVLD